MALPQARLQRLPDRCNLSRDSAGLALFEVVLRYDRHL